MLDLSLHGDGIKAKNIFGVWRHHDFNTSKTSNSFAIASEYRKYFIEWLVSNNDNNEVSKWSTYGKKNLIVRSWKILRKNNSLLQTSVRDIFLPHYINIAS